MTSASTSGDPVQGYRGLGAWQWCVRCGALLRHESVDEHDEAHARRDLRAGG